MTTFILRPVVLLATQRSARLCLNRPTYSFVQTRYARQRPFRRFRITNHEMDFGLHNNSIDLKSLEDDNFMPPSFWQWVHSGASLPPTQSNGSPWPLIEGKKNLIMNERLSNLHNYDDNPFHLATQIKVMKDKISAKEPPFSMVEFTKYVDASLEEMLEKDIAKWMVLLRDTINVFHFLNAPVVAAAFTTTRRRISQEVCFYAAEWNRLIETGEMRNERKIYNAAELVEEFYNSRFPELARLAWEHFEEGYNYALEKLEARERQDENLKLWRKRLMAFYERKAEMKYPGF